MDETTRRLVEQLRQFSTPELCDGCAERRVMDYHIKPRTSEKRIAGPALYHRKNEGVRRGHPPHPLAGQTKVKGYHWFMLPDGIRFELKEQKS